MIAQELSIFRRLEAAGCEYSRPLQTLDDRMEWSYSMAFEQEVQDFRVFEDLIDSKFDVRHGQAVLDGADIYKFAT
jgi:hypothetical protein